jgi:hypothetical protein
MSNKVNGGNSELRAVGLAYRAKSTRFIALGELLLSAQPGLRFVLQ